MSHPALKAGGLAVITGSGSGIGYAAARAFVKSGMNVVLADLPSELFTSNTQNLIKEYPKSRIVAVETDVSKFEQLENLQSAVNKDFKGQDIGILMLNAGVSRPSVPFAREELDQRTLTENYNTILNTNLWGVINGIQAFLPLLVKQQSPSAVICTGSKQGITNPPGNPAYNLSKAAVKSYTESLAHDIRTNYSSSPISVHLFVPGWVFTGLTGSNTGKPKPPGAWTPDQCVDSLISGLHNGDFYILCEDNDVKRWQDIKRIEWNTRDITENRTALSRWDKKYEKEFAEYLESGRPKQG